MVNVAPGAIEPEFQAPLLAVVVCVVVSLLVQVMLPPTDTVIGFGAKALVVKVDAPLTIDTGVPDAPDEGVVGVGLAGVEYDEPHPDKTIETSTAAAIRVCIAASLWRLAPQGACRPPTRL